jgi:tetratricopeptide (TPR) repeat protein
MRRFSIFLVLLVGGFMLMGANGCSSDPNVEGAKLDLRNKDYDRALENVDEALARDPENAEALELKGRILQEQAETIADPAEHRQVVQEMMQAYNRAIELEPSFQDVISQRLALAYFNEFSRGVEAFNRGSDENEAYAEAAQYFALAGEIQPDSAGAFVNQAFALLNSGNSESAIEPLKLAIEKGDTQPETYIFLAELYVGQNQPEEAIRVLEQASELHPENTDIQAQLLNAYVQTGEVDEAREQYRRAVEQDPENKLYLYNLGSLLLEAEEYEEAIEHLSKAVEIDPSYANAQYNLGAAYVNMAVDLSEEVSDADDRLREERNQLSAAQIQEREQEIESMAEERRSLFETAIGPLEQAKSLMEQSGNDPSQVCQALFSAYVQTDQQQRAEAIAECAGYEDLN